MLKEVIIKLRVKILNSLKVEGRGKKANILKLIDCSGVYILQNYKFYSPVPQMTLQIFLPTFFLKSAKKVPKSLIKSRADPPNNWLLLQF